MPLGVAAFARPAASGRNMPWPRAEAKQNHESQLLQPLRQWKMKLCFVALCNQAAKAHSPLFVALILYTYMERRNETNFIVVLLISSEQLSLLMEPPGQISHSSGIQEPNSKISEALYQYVPVQHVTCLWHLERSWHGLSSLIKEDHSTSSDIAWYYPPCQNHNLRLRFVEATLKIALENLQGI